MREDDRWVKTSIYYTYTYMTSTIKDKDNKLKDFIKKGGRKGAKKDFLTLLKKAVTSKSKSVKSG